MGEMSYRPERPTSTEGPGREAPSVLETQEEQTGGGEGAQQVAGRVREGAQQATAQVQERAQEVRAQASGRVREEVDRRSTQAGEQVRSVADAARRTGDTLRNEGNERPARLVEQAAERIERLGGYLEETDGDRLLRDIEDFGRRQPWVAAAVGAALGFFAARFVKASSRERYESQGGASWTARARPDVPGATARDYSVREPALEVPPTPTVEPTIPPTPATGPTTPGAL